jgi:hypothetical protein
MRPFSGSGSWALTRTACEHVLTVVDGNPRLVDFFRTVFAPDESFVQTILGNSPFVGRMRRELVYTDWTRSPNGHPNEICEGHLELFERQNEVTKSDVYGPGELLFARKFTDSRLDLVDRVDALIERKEGICLRSA